MRSNIFSEYLNKKELIQSRLKEFKDLPEKKYLDELMFCTLTPQSNAKKCWQAVEEIKKLRKINSNSLLKILKTKTRFHNNKTKYLIYNINNWNKIKEKINSNSDIKDLRNWLAENVYGYGLKEASHFLRNIGKSNNKIAILDRHILRNLKKIKIIENDKIKNKNEYFYLEEKFIKLSQELKIPADELDLLFWSQETGEIFK